MTIQDMTAQARALRSQFTEVDAAEGRRSWTTDEVMLGFVGDVGDLAKLVLGKTGVRPRADLDAALSHELADCLWSLLVLADEYDIDLEQAYSQLVATLGEEFEEKLAATAASPQAGSCSDAGDGHGDGDGDGDGDGQSAGEPERGAKVARQLTVGGSVRLRRRGDAPG